MANSKPEYVRLTGRKRRISGYSQLWMAPDHLLLVKSSRMVEHYQRFALRDIQAVVVTELPERPAAKIAALTLSIVGAVGFFSGGGMALKILAAIAAIAGVAAIVGNIALGTRCRCHLYSAISRELLEPVSRVRTARIFLERVRAAIEPVQGSLPEGASVAEIPVETPAPEIPKAPGYLPEILFGLFLVNAALALANLRFPRAEISNVLPTTVTSEVILLIVALARRRGRDARQVVYWVMIAAIACLGWDATRLATGFVQAMASIVETPRRGQPGDQILIAAFSAFARSQALFGASWRAAAGAVGLTAAWMERPG